jgi:hypothetical protein
MSKRFLCKIGWHKYLDVKTQRTILVGFGFSGCEMPGWRIVRKCAYCGDVGHMSLNLMMPNKYLHQEELWKDV